MPGWSRPVSEDLRYTYPSNLHIFIQIQIQVLVIDIPKCEPHQLPVDAVNERGLYWLCPVKRFGMFNSTILPFPLEEKDLRLNRAIIRPCNVLA